MIRLTYWKTSVGPRPTRVKERLRYGWGEGVGSLYNEIPMSHPSDPHAMLGHLGWSPFFENDWARFEGKNLRPGRVAAQYRSHYYVAFGGGETRPARVSGAFRHRAESGADYPAVGDFVAAEAPGTEGEAVIRGVMARRTKFSRKVVGVKSEEQVLVSNVDVVFLVMGLDGDYNPRRLERYLVVAHDSGAEPVVLLTKSDLSPDLAADLRESRSLAPGVAVHALCPPRGEGLDEVLSHLGDGVTAVLLGSSGVGKSTLANRLLGEEVQPTQTVRETDSQGRHTTTHRQMFRLRGGALLIDTPGLREIQLWVQDRSGVDDTFADIVELGVSCRFSDCRHESEPGCAVKAAVEEGRLSRERWESYGKLKKELKYVERRTSWKSQREHQKNMKSIAQARRKDPKRGRDHGHD